jgi:hypothetical protein
MSLSSSSGNTRLSGDASAVAGLSLTLNNSLVLGFNCAPLAMGKSNSYMGYGAAERVRAGNYNTVYGFMAGQNMSGDDNVYVGLVCAQNAGAAGGNLFIGTRCGLSCTTGCNSVLLGTDADMQVGTDVGAVAVGYAAKAGPLHAVSVGAYASAFGRQAIAIGYGTRVVGDGNFNIANRVRGYFAAGPSAEMDTYSVQIDADEIKVAGALALCHHGGGTNAPPQWLAYLEAPRSGFADLVFRSANNAVVRFTDEFYPSIFDFTGQHRCVFSRAPLGDADAAEAGSEGRLTGCIVVASGRYRDLQGRGGVIHMDEALPEVELSTAACDPRVFGVISSFEPAGQSGREYRLGNLAFGVPCKDRRVVVNAAGEGAIWVCDAGGPLRNGDLVVSSHLPGLGMRQHDDALRSCTVAKVTCDCDFGSAVPTFGERTQVEVVTHDGRRYRAARVGCTYKT